MPDLRITGAESETKPHKSRGITSTCKTELVDDGIEIRRRWTVAKADDSEDLAIGLKILPGAGRGPTKYEFESKGAVVPWLISKGRFLVLCVEGTDGGERDRVVTQEHGVIVAHDVGRHRTDWEDGDADHAGCLDAYIWLHFGI